MKLLLIFFVLSLGVTAVYGESDSVDVSFVNNTASSYLLEFDSDEKLFLEQPYSWIRDNHSRHNLLSYSIDGEKFVPIPRQSRGTFSIDIPPDSNSIVFLSTVQFPVSVDATHTFLPASPTHDDWFDINSEITITAKSDNDGLIPYTVKSWEGFNVDSFGNDAKLIVDRPVSLKVVWGIDYTLFLPLLIIPILFILYKVKSKNTLPKSTATDNVIPSIISEDYDEKIQSFFKEKSLEKLDSLLYSKTISNTKYNKIKENL